MDRTTRDLDPSRPSTVADSHLLLAAPNRARPVRCRVSGMLLRRGTAWEFATQGWKVVGVRKLSGTGEDRQRRALRMIGGAFVTLAGHLAVQSMGALSVGHRPGHDVFGRLGSPRPPW